MGTRALTELGLVAYLLLVPAGNALPAWGRELALAVVLAGLVLARLPMGRRACPRPAFRLLAPLALFALSTLLSVVFSAFPGRSLARAAYAPVAVLLFLAAQEVAVTRAAYRRLLLALGALPAVLGVDGVYQFATGASLLGGSLPASGRVTASLPHPNDLALISILLPAALAAALQPPPSLASRLLLAGVPFALATVILSESRNAWLGLAVGLVALAAAAWRLAGVAAGAARRQRRFTVAAAAVAAGLFAGAIALGIGGIPERTRTILEPAREPRIALWRVAWRMFGESPVVGKGLHTFGEFHRPYLGKLGLPVGAVSDPDAIPWAHNLYLEILAERGLAGAVAFGGCLIALAMALGRFLRRETAGPEPRLLALGLGSSLATFLVLGLFDLTFLKDWVMLVFWLLAALIVRLPSVSSAEPVDGAGSASSRLPGRP